MLNVNLFGGPGTGKSTTAAGIFYSLKSAGEKIEYIQEYAKELTFGKDFTKLSDQLLILGEQHHRLHRLKGQVNYIVHDSPFIMGLTYLQQDPHLPRDMYYEMVVTMFKSYDNLNIFLQRDIEAHGYQEYGRNQTLREAEYKDMEIKQMLDLNKIPYITIVVGPNTVEEIITCLKRQL